MKVRKLKTLVPIILGLALSMALAVSLHAQTPADPANLPQRDGSHDFDFLIGDWKAMSAAFRIVSTTPMSGTSTMASRITINSSTATRTSSSSR
jgi:hypothetical protein